MLWSPYGDEGMGASGFLCVEVTSTRTHAHKTHTRRFPSSQRREPRLFQERRTILSKGARSLARSLRGRSRSRSRVGGAHRGAARARRRVERVAQPRADRLSPSLSRSLRSRRVVAARPMEQQQKIVFRDGAASGFEPAPLNRRRPPESTSPPREAGASRSRELPHKQRSDMRRRAQGTRGRSRKRPVGGRSRPCNAGTAVTQHKTVGVKFKKRLPPDY